VIPSILSRSYSTFPLCSGTTLIEIAVYICAIVTLLQNPGKDFTDAFSWKHPEWKCFWVSITYTYTYTYTYTASNVRLVYLWSWCISTQLRPLVRRVHFNVKLFGVYLSFYLMLLWIPWYTRAIIRYLNDISTRYEIGFCLNTPYLH
jgi:hypothetical protein